MLHLTSDKFGACPISSMAISAARLMTDTPVVWIVSINATDARVFSRVVADIRQPAQDHETSRDWWLEPEVGMQLETFSHAPERDDAIKCQLSRLIGGLLSLARAGGRFDQLVVVAAESTRRHLRAYLNAMTRNAIIAELDETRSDRPEALRSSLRTELPAIFV